MTPTRPALALGWVVALAMAVALPAMADERGSRHEHGFDRPHHGPMVVPEGVVVPAWSELSPDQQKHLARMKDKWDTLPASRRVLALEHAERRMRWEGMSSEERERIRKGMRNYRDLSPAQREKMREAMQVMRGLPAEQRQALADQWRAMSPEQRRAWLETGGPGVSPAPGTPAD